MGILIRLNLVGNKDELNVKVLNDENLSSDVESTPNVLANFNVSFNRKNGEKDADIVVESDKSSQQRSNNADKENNGNVISDRVLRQMSFSGKADEPDIICSDGDEDDDENGGSLEEYFVVEKVLGNRFNPQTNQNEFLLKLKDCKPLKNKWNPVTGSKTFDFPQEDGRLYVQKSQNLEPLKKRRNEEATRCARIARLDNASPIIVDLDKEPAPPSPLGISVGNVRQSDLTSSDFANADFEHGASHVEPSYCSYFVDTDSVQSIGDVSIKCEPLIESVQGNSDYDFETATDPIHYGRSPYYNGAVTVDENYDEDVKPNLSDLNSSTPFVCSQCGRSFTAIQYLRRHETIHTKAKIYTCSICPHAFGNGYLLSLHERNVHAIRPRRRRRGFAMTKRRPAVARPSDDKPFQCPLCIRSFADRHALTLHEQVHNGGRLFPCDYCDRVFTYLHALKNHERIHLAVKSLPCSYCGKLFSMLARLKLHERKHRSELAAQAATRNEKNAQMAGGVEGKLFTCPQCPKKFRLKHTMQIHMRQHTGEKPYACSMCDYRSAQKVSLSCHMRKHQREWQMEMANDR